MYDAIVIGSGISGLMCANILAHSGCRVLVLEKQPRIGGMLQGFSRQGVTYDTGLHYVGGLNEGGPLEWLFRYHGLMDLPWVKLDLSEEVVLDGISYLIPCGDDEFVNGLLEYFPDEKDSLENYIGVLSSIRKSVKYIDADKLGLLSQSAHSFLQESVPNPLLRKVLSSMGLRMEMDPETLPLYEYAQINASFIESAWRLDGPSSMIPSTIATQIRQQGGEILTGIDVTGIKEGEVIAADRSFKAKYIISSLTPAATVSKIDGLREVYKKRISELENTFGILSVYIELIPDTLRYINHSITIDNDVYISFNVPKDGSPWADRLELMVPVRHWPSERNADYEAWKENMARELIRVAETRLTGLEQAIKTCFASTPLTWQRYTGSASSFGVKKDYRSALTTVISPRTPINNVYLTGQSLGLHGLLGSSLSALHTSAQIVGYDFIKQSFSI